MGLLAAILLAVWLVGIGVTAFSVVHTVKHNDDETTQRFRQVLDEYPFGVTAILTVLVLFWPATLAFSLATKRK